MEHNEIHDVNEKLSDSIGTYYWYQNIAGKIYTDGVAELRIRYKCFWLIDDILCQAAQIKEPFQLWQFERQLSETGEKLNRFVLTCDDGNGNIVYSKKCAYSGYEGDILRLYYCNEVLMLPSEY